MAGLRDLVHGHGGAEVSGPVGIVRTSAQVLQVGVQWYLMLLGVISMSVVLFNLLPLLQLDGGNILFAVTEAVTYGVVSRTCGHETCR